MVSVDEVGPTEWDVLNANLKALADAISSIETRLMVLEAEVAELSSA